jgi:hypothetical protein
VVPLVARLAEQVARIEQIHVRSIQLLDQLTGPLELRIVPSMASHAPVAAEGRRVSSEGSRWPRAAGVSEQGR